MLVYKKYEILNLDFVGESKLPILDSKYKYISDFMFRQIQGKFVFLFEMNPTKTSVLYDIDTECVYHTINSRKVIYTNNINLNKEIILKIVEDESFYLGHLLFVIGLLKEDKVINISNMWENLLETGLEYFRMGNDGESFYWCNPQDLSAEKKFKLFVDEFTNATKRLE